MFSRIALFCPVLLALFVCRPRPVQAAETDQYLAWEVELRDCSDAFNRYLNQEVKRFLEKKNRAKRAYTPEKLTQKLYLHLFQGIHHSRLRRWLRRSEEVDRFPENSVSFFQYQRMSIYRDLSFPYILPMARTICVNGVYLGTDKISHFFGFGRRYYKRYLRYRKKGFSEEEAVEKVIYWGIHVEKTLVGGLVDGIFSHGDLEAAFQGFRLAKALCAGPDPYIVHDGSEWQLAREIDIRDYVTPDFDESYNNSSYWGARRRHVLSVLNEEYCPKVSLPIVEERFARYEETEPSLSRRVIAAYFEDKENDARKEQSIIALGSSLE
ncbi:MAG TPA: hypothetical protein HPP83_09360 [Candidatus Hydrogenedentes bacterium]|nr:hypothetical protein [Candidatus Hydrogenedentota bacterium]